MEIDWITVSAQIVNFLVLVWLLHRFLYGPITRAMKRREDRIADRLREAEEKRKEAESEAEELRNERKKLENRRDEILEEARADAEEERKSLEEEARAEIERRRKEWRKSLEEDQSAFLDDFRRMATNEFYTLNRRVLRDLADAELESRFASAFVDRLGEMDEALRDRVVKACRDADGVTVTSRFELSSNDRRQVTKAVHEEISKEADVTYRQSDDVGCGIELRVGSQAVSWNLESYFDGLRDALAETIERQTRGAGEDRAEDEDKDKAEDEQEKQQGKAEEPAKDDGETGEKGADEDGDGDEDEDKSENRRSER